MPRNIILLGPTITLLGCGQSSAPPTLPPPAIISMAAGDWNILYSPGMPAHPGPLANGGWYFDFPIYDHTPTTDCNPNSCPSVHYVTTATGATIAGKTLSAKIQIGVTGSPTFQYQLASDNICINAATVRLFFERRNDPMTADAQYYRWCSNPTAYTLASGFATLAVPVTPDKWSSVFGKFGNADVNSQQGFVTALQDLGSVGLTFGGGCLFGHGVNINSSKARFTVTEFRAD
jgi:hypothetical protein